MNTYIVTVSDLDGEPKLDAHGGALLYGVSVDQITAIAPGPVPADWTRAMRRRASGAFAATGGDDLLDILEYWARVEHQAELGVGGEVSEPKGNHAHHAPRAAAAYGLARLAEQ